MANNGDFKFYKKDSMDMQEEELREFLDEKVGQYNNPSFIEEDPVSIPHRFTKKEDIEIAGFLTATIAWGNRRMILKNASRMMDLMGDSPYDYVVNSNSEHSDSLDGFVHRTFNSSDLKFFIAALKNIYLEHGGLENIFVEHQAESSLQAAIHELKKVFLLTPHPDRVVKHLADPMKGSAAKRINMFLRWMVRKDSCGVDFGLWGKISPSKLSCPLDVHSGNVARKLGLLSRKQNDAKAVIELDACLRRFDEEDPVKYDFALFSLGVAEKF